MIHSYLGPCAWLQCKADDCQVEEDFKSRKLLRLPLCDEHRGRVKKLRQPYKINSRLRECCNVLLLQRSKQETLDLHSELNLLNGTYSALKSELKGRYELKNSIKPIYRDRGHNTRLDKLVKQAMKLEREIEKLQKRIHSNTTTNLAAASLTPAPLPTPALPLPTSPSFSPSLSSSSPPLSPATPLSILPSSVSPLSMEHSPLSSSTPSSFAFSPSSLLFSPSFTSSTPTSPISSPSFSSSSSSPTSSPSTTPSNLFTALVSPRSRKNNRVTPY